MRVYIFLFALIFDVLVLGEEVKNKEIIRVESTKKVSVLEREGRDIPYGKDENNRHKRSDSDSPIGSLRLSGIDASKQLKAKQEEVRDRRQTGQSDQGTLAGQGQSPDLGQIQTKGSERISKRQATEVLKTTTIQEKGIVGNGQGQQNPGLMQQGQQDPGLMQQGQQNPELMQQGQQDPGLMQQEQRRKKRNTEAEQPDQGKARLDKGLEGQKNSVTNVHDGQAKSRSRRYQTYGSISSQLIE